MAKVIIVDDELVSAFVLATLLKDEHHDVRTVGNAEEALSVASEFIPDVLVTDYRLGGELDGIELARKLQQKEPTLQMVLCTGLPIDDVEPEARASGFSEIFEKPCDPDRVVASVNRLISHRPIHEHGTLA